MSPAARPDRGPRAVTGSVALGRMIREPSSPPPQRAAAGVRHASAAHRRGRCIVSRTCATWTVASPSPSTTLDSWFLYPLTASASSRSRRDAIDAAGLDHDLPSGPAELPAEASAVADEHDVIVTPPPRTPGGGAATGRGRGAGAQRAGRRAAAAHPRGVTARARPGPLGRRHTPAILRAR